jgi:hypothetical protein
MRAAAGDTGERAPLPLSVALGLDPDAAARLLEVAASSDGPLARDLAEAATRGAVFRMLLEVESARRGLAA